MATQVGEPFYARRVPTAIVAILGVFLAAVVVLVLVGMVQGADPNFSKGRSPTASVVAQEVVGALAVVALAGVIFGYLRTGRGKRIRPLLIVLPVGLVLLAGWLFAYAVERAS
jgi:hypothetical protein